MTSTRPVLRNLSLSVTLLSAALLCNACGDALSDGATFVADRDEAGRVGDNEAQSASSQDLALTGAFTPDAASMSLNANAPQGSALIGGPTIDPNAFWPPTGQDCGVQLSTRGGNVLTKPPQAYLDSCAGCHGPAGTGAGKGLYPNIVGARGQNAFTTIVRQGILTSSPPSPAFKSAWLTDNELLRIYAFLTGARIKETGRCSTKAVMNSNDIAAAATAGLAAWRTFDGSRDPAGITSNVACASCHAPDALDLAYYGYSDGDLMRRALHHLPADKATAIVDWVHALRAKYSIGRRDPLASRPFQPGGAVLNGNTIAERDAAFAQQLATMGLTVASRPINSVADANLAMSEVWSINRHTLPIPIPYNHYTEDGFHNPNNYVSDCNSNIDGCADHGSIADWIPVAGHVPNDFNNYFKQADQYLQSPNDKTFANFRYAAATSPMNGNYTGIYYGTDGLDRKKYPSLVLANYCIRLELTGQPTCYQKGLTPFANMADIWDVGSTVNLYGTGYGRYPDCDTNWTSCSQAPAKLPQWPAHLLGNITPGATLSSNFSRLRGVWMDMWWTHFDPTLLVTGDPTAQKDEYFTRSLYWVNNNDWTFNNTPATQLHPAYASYNAYQVMVHNIATLMTPSLASCRLFPATDLTCTAVDLRSGYWPNLVNFAEQNQPWNPQSVNNINYQVAYQPASGTYRAQYQLFVTNLYRMFFWGLIGQLQQSNWMCNTSLQNLRIARAQVFFAQAETQASNAAQDTARFSTLQQLMAKTAASCPPLTSSVD